MINRIINWSIKNRALVLTASIALLFWGLFVIYHTPVDAIPDLSDIQVIIKTKYSGRSPKVVEEQVTYPLTTTMMSVPTVKVVRGFSYFGESFVYVLFNEGTDLYWARSRVLEYLNQAIGKLPKDVKPELGPDATGIGWVYQYALVDKSGKYDISQLRTLQDWFLKFELRSVPGIAEITSVGGMVKQYQVVPDPNKLKAYKISIPQIITSIQNSNNVGGGSVIELGEAEYMLNSNGYLHTLTDFEQVPIMFGMKGTPVLLKDIARIQLGPEVRRGVTELNGQGEAVGGIIIMRSGENALKVINNVKEKLQSLQSSLPEGVEIITTYDRSKIIERSITNLKQKLIEESFAVIIICALFLMHFRSSLIIVITLPLGVLSAFIVMYYQGVNANIMSLGGIAIAIGAMVDASIVMIENAHKHFQDWRKDNPNLKLKLQDRILIITRATNEVGSALFFSLLIITVSFLPIFMLQAQEGMLFKPLAYTKSYAMAAAAMLSITLVPVLMVYLIRGKLLSEEGNPINLFLITLYKKLLIKFLSYPKTTLTIASLCVLLTLYPISKLGAEFMPALQEGDLLYMPSALPGISIGKATHLLQQTDKLIATIPEVKTVFGKIGRADTTTDPAPIEMFETMIQLNEPEKWRPGLTIDKLIAELNEVVKVPGLINVWVQPIRNRIDMLSTGIKSTIGIKISGADLKIIEEIGSKVEKVLKSLPNTRSAYAERVNTGRYIDIHTDRTKAARYGFNIGDVNEVINTVIGGENIGEVVNGLERYPINIRYPQSWRDSPLTLMELPMISSTGIVTTLGNLADIKIAEGASMYKTENTRPTGWIYIDIEGYDIESYIQTAKKSLSENLKLPVGYTMSWSGQYEYLQRAAQQLMLVVPLTLMIIFFMMYLLFKNIAEPLLIMVSLPFAVIGGFWLVYILGYNISVAVAVGFIALAGIATEFGIVMLIYLRSSLNKSKQMGTLNGIDDLKEAIIEGAALRVRPKTMTVMVILMGLLPIMLSHGTGSEIMQRIAAPVIGGMITAPLLSMIVIPVLYMLIQRRKLG